jgi:hypothetical protein
MEHCKARTRITFPMISSQRRTSDFVFWNIEIFCSKSLFRIIIWDHFLYQMSPDPFWKKICTLHSKPYPISKTEIPLHWKLHRIHFGPYDPKFTGRRCALPQRGISAQSTVGTRSRVILRYQSRTLNTH